MHKENQLMIKGLRKCLPLMLLAMVLLLSACGKEPVFDVTTNGDNSISVTADRAAEGSSGTGHLTVGPDGQVMVDAEGLNKDGKLSLRFAAGAFGPEDFPAEPSFETTVSGGDSAAFTAEPGEYTVSVTAEGKVTGTARIRAGAQ